MKLLNYIGQLRIYSLVDLTLLLYVAGARPGQLGFWGAVLLWIGFLAFLESKHKHQNRARVSCLIAYIVWFAGLILFWKVEGLLYLAFSMIYSKKNAGQWGKVSPFARGLQTFVMVGSFSGYLVGLPYLACIVITTRNFFGDWRDAESDRQEGLQTWPSIWAWNSKPWIHFGGLLATTLVWWSVSKLSVVVLIVTWIAEASTYWLTPRSLNRFPTGRRIRSRQK